MTWAMSSLLDRFSGVFRPELAHLLRAREELRAGWVGCVAWDDGVVPVAVEFVSVQG